MIIGPVAAVCCSDPPASLLFPLIGFLTRRLPSHPACPSAVVKRKPAITNTQLTKAARNGNGNGNGNGRAVAPEEAKVSWRAAG